MSGPRILFLDIDDTLLNSKKEITPEVSSAIGRALKEGHRIVITTGRPISGAIKLIRRLNLTEEGCYAICYNGGQIWDCFADRSVYSIPVPMKDVRYLFEKANEAGIHVQTYDRLGIICASYDRELEDYVNKVPMEVRIDPGIPDSLTEEPIKVLMIDMEDHDRLVRFRQDISDWCKGRISSFFSNPYYLEFVREGISKGAAVRTLADMLGIPMENTVAAGDSENDIPMIEAAHIGCAMANATEETKAAADYITERSCEESGVAEIIEKFIL